MHFNKDIILTAGRGREFEILRDVAGISAEYLDGKHHACPKCGGKDRFRLIDKDAGAVFCNQCFREQNGDFIAAVMWGQDCSFDEALSLIGEYLGLTDTGTHPAKSAQAQTRGTKTGAMRGRAGRVETPAKGEAKLKLAAAYDYTDGNGNQTYRVERYEDTVDGSRRKQFRQLTFLNGEWRGGLVDTPGAAIGTPKRIPYPYHYPRLISDEVKTVFIVEGEKCVERLQEVLDTVEQPGQYAVSTLAGGSKNMKFWGDHAKILEGLKVYLLPDNDKAGTDGASAAVESLDAAGIDVQVIPFEGRPEKFDVADWIEEQRAAGLTDRKIGETFLNAFPAKGIEGIGWVDGLADAQEPKLKFPLEYFPDFFRDYCAAVAETVSVDVSFPAYALLSGAAYATAYRVTYSYRHYQDERLFFHSMLVAHSGAGKSPVWSYMLFPLDEKEEAVRVENQKLIFDWRGLSAAERKKTRPPRLTLSPIVHKPTIEKVEQAVSAIWEQSQGIDEFKQGIFLPYDEGAYLLGSMNAYKGNGAKSDESALIPMLDGLGGGSDRAGTDANGLPTSRYFADCHVTIYATIQNDILKSITKDKPLFFQQGFLQRFAFTVPDFVPKKPLAETKAFDSRLKKEYRVMFNGLFNIGGNLTLSKEAEKIYLGYEAAKTADYNARGVLGETRSGFDAVCLSLNRKGMKQVLEVAALLNVLYAACEGYTVSENRTITALEMEGAVKIMDFRDENFQRLYRLTDAGGGRGLKERIEQAIEEAGPAGLTLRALTRKFFQRQSAQTVRGFMQELLKKNPKIRKEKGQKGGDTYIIQP